MSIIIRPAREQDANACSHVLCSSIKELCIKDHGNRMEIVNRWISNKSTENLSRWIADVQSDMYIAEFSGEVCGVGAISRTGEVTLNYVSPEFQFKGVSKKMLTVLEEALRTYGFKSARLNSTVTAHSFYKAVGWVDSGKPDTWLGMTNYPMIKNL